MTRYDIPFIADIEALRRDFHAHPELAFEELRTADIIARELSAYGLSVHRGLAKTGVVGVLRKGGSPRAIGLRADIDALPIEEKNTFAHCSVHRGQMHACGHDGHTAILLGAARYLSENIASLNFDGTVYFIFQPAEESEGGGRVMVEEGLFEQFPMDAVYGLHNWPGIPAGEMAIMPGPVMAGTSTFEITVQGKGCHAAMPHQGSDVLVAASQFVLALQTVVSRNLHPCDAGVISVTQIHGGEVANALPDTVVLRGTIRSFRHDVEVAIEKAVGRLCVGVGETFGVRFCASFDQRYPATINDPEETRFCFMAASDVLGTEKIRRDEMPSMGAEDFSYMLCGKPGCYVWLGNGPESSGCMLHNARYDFNDAILPIGIRYWVRLVENRLG